MRWIHTAVAGAVLLAACSDAPITEPTAPQPVVASGKYELGGLTMQVTRASNGETVVVARTDAGDGPRIVYISRTLSSNESYVTFVTEGKLVTARRAGDGTISYVNKHNQLKDGSCGDRWASAERIGDTVQPDCDGAPVVAFATCIDTPDYSCGGGGDESDGVCCESERDAYQSALSDMFWASGAVSAACFVPQPLEPFACAAATAYYLTRVYQYNVAANKYNSCKDAARSNPRCKVIVYGVPWPKKEVLV
jgi:hypothetical protein